MTISIPRIEAPQKNLSSQIMVIAVGFIITIITCLTLYFFVGGGLKEEAQKARTYTLTTLINSLETAQESLKTATLLSTFLCNTDRCDPALAKNIPNIGLFDQILLVTEIYPRTWQSLDIYIRTPDPQHDAPKRWRLPPDFAKTAQTLSLHTSTITTDFLGLTESSMETKDDPLFFIWPLHIGTNKAFLIAHTRMGNIIKNKNENVFLNVYLGQSTLPLYVDGILIDGGAGSDPYTFMAGGQEWRALIAYNPENQDLFLTRLPFYLGGLGVLLTLLITLYMRGYQHQAYLMNSMNKALEKKNFEMEIEIMERERASRALRKAEQDNLAVINSVNDIIFEINEEAHILFLNTTWAKLTGFDVEQSLGSVLFDFLPMSDRDQARKGLDGLLRRGGTYRLLTSVRTIKGSFHSIMFTLSLVKREEGSSRLIGTMTDVEDRTQAKKALVEAEKKFRAIVENAAGGIYQITPEGLYLSANAALARILGYDEPQDLLHKVKNAHRAIYVNAAARRAFVQELELKGTARAEVEMMRKDGSTIWVMENARTVRDEETEKKSILYYEGSIEDITARRAADIALRTAKMQSDMASHVKSAFLANMSHELRTPLNTIIGFAQIIKDATLGPVGISEYQDYARDIYNIGCKFLGIVNEILDVSKIEAGQRQLNETEVDVSRVISAAVAICEERATKAQVRIVVDLGSESLPLVIGEEMAIKQILLNLLSNAVQFTPEGGRVTITALLGEKGTLELAISDTGIGMDEEEMRLALEPFGQVDTDLARAGTGTGLGLTLVKALMALHGGEFELISQKGIGTTARIIFPAERVVRL